MTRRVALFSATAAQEGERGLRVMLRLVLWMAKLTLIVFAGAIVWATWQTNELSQSACYGSPRQGRLEGGKRPPMSGVNYASYSHLMWAIGRTSMHGAVRDTIVEAYAELAETMPDAWYVYGESGWPRGGPFPPHKTHRNGLSVDFFVPVRDSWGNATAVPVWPWNWMGYEVRFDRNGQRPGMTIDFEAMARHFDALIRAGEKHGVGLKFVILEVELQRKMMETPTGRTLKGKIPFSTRRAWVPHDGHYHVDFDVKCRA